MLSEKVGNKVNRYVSDYVIFDLETTGVSCNSDEVVEISAVKVIGGNVVDEFSTLVNPGRSIPAQASAVNGITDDMVADAPAFQTALNDFNEFVGELPLVGHNINTFDIKFICRDAMKYWNKTFGNDYIDTLVMARACLPGLGHYKLVDLAEHYGISPEGAHRALNDCRMNQKVFEKLAEELRNQPGGTTVAKICSKCGNIMVIRNGKFGEFWGCTGFPDCRNTERI